MCRIQLPGPLGLLSVLEAGADDGVETREEEERVSAARTTSAAADSADAWPPLLAPPLLAAAGEAKPATEPRAPAAPRRDACLRKSLALEAAAATVATAAGSTAPGDTVCFMLKKGATMRGCSLIDGGAASSALLPAAARSRSAGAGARAGGGGRGSALRSRSKASNSAGCGWGASDCPPLASASGAGVIGPEAEPAAEPTRLARREASWPARGRLAPPVSSPSAEADAVAPASESAGGSPGGSSDPDAVRGDAAAAAVGVDRERDSMDAGIESDGPDTELRPRPWRSRWGLTRCETIERVRANAATPGSSPPTASPEPPPPSPRGDTIKRPPGGTAGPLLEAEAEGSAATRTMERLPKLLPRSPAAPLLLAPPMLTLSRLYAAPRLSLAVVEDPSAVASPAAVEASSRRRSEYARFRATGVPRTLPRSTSPNEPGGSTVLVGERAVTSA